MNSCRSVLMAVLIVTWISPAYAERPLVGSVSASPYMTASTQAFLSLSDKAVLEAEALRLANAWNSSRNTAQSESFLQVIHPGDRDNGKAFVNAMPRALIAGNATIRVTNVKSIDGRRQLITVERVWGGSRPGKSTWRLEASEYEGRLYLRIPGGDLSLPKGIKPVVSEVNPGSPVEPVATDAPTHSEALKVPFDLRLGEPVLPYNDGKVYESGVDVKPIVAPLPKIPLRVSISGTHGVARFGEWLRVCEEASSEASCYLEALLYDQKNKSRFLLIRARAHESGKIAAQFFTPTEIALRAGLTIKVANHSNEGIAFEICRREHCEANYVLDQRGFSRSDAGLSLLVAYQAEKNKSTQFVVSFVDFFRAIETP